MVAVDLRGHGKTDRVRERFSIDDLADDVAAVLAALGPGRYTVVGYSLGGLVAQALAAAASGAAWSAWSWRLRRPTWCAGPGPPPPA